jgi:hypothetical protein
MIRILFFFISVVPSILIWVNKGRLFSAFQSGNIPFDTVLLILLQLSFLGILFLFDDDLLGKLKKIGILFSCIGMFGTCSLISSYGRYLWIKCEVEVYTLGMTHALGDGSLRDYFGTAILDYSTKGWIVKDTALMKHLIAQRKIFGRDAHELFLICAALRTNGESLDSILNVNNGQKVILAASTVEATPNPWFLLDWFDDSSFDSQPEYGLMAGVLTTEIITQAVEKEVQELSTLKKKDLELLWQVLVSHPGIVQEETRQKVEDAWFTQNPKLQSALKLNIEQASAIHKWLDGTKSVRLYVELNDQRELGGYHSGDVRIVSLLIAQLIRYSGVQVVWSNREEADTILSIDCSQVEIGVDRYKTVRYKYVVQTVTRMYQPLDVHIGQWTTQKRELQEDGYTEQEVTLYAMQFSFALKQDGKAESFVSEDNFFDFSRMFTHQNLSDEANQTHNQLWPFGITMRNNDIANQHWLFMLGDGISF